MRLRNKKTGKIWHMPRLRQPTVQEDDISFFACIGEHGCSRGELFSYKSLAELNADWEDYKPAEPLIKDEKIRKAVRAWAEINRVDKVRYATYCSNEYTLIYQKIDTNLWIQFESSIGELVVDQSYTIAELCGEEEEWVRRSIAY